MSSSFRDLWGGLAWAATAILIWSGSLVMLRLGVSGSLNAYDLTFLRFGVSAVLLAPVLLFRGTGSDRLGTLGVVTMVVAFGAPYVLLISLALETASAAAAGALNPGVMAIAAVCLGRAAFGDRIGPPRLLGTGLAALGIGSYTWADGDFGTGHMILVATGFMWASYALIVRRNAVPALAAAAIIAVGSALAYVPVYLIVLPKKISTAPLTDILQQVVFQGMLVSVVAIYAFNRSGELLGRVAGATLPALIPVVTLALAGLFLGESIDLAEFAAAAAISAGVALILIGKPLSDKIRRSLGYADDQRQAG